MEILLEKYYDLFITNTNSKSISSSLQNLENFIFNFDLILRSNSTKKFGLDFPKNKNHQKYQVNFLNFKRIISKYIQREEEMMN